MTHDVGVGMTPFTIQLGPAFGGATIAAAPIAPLADGARATWSAALHPEELALTHAWADRRLRTFAAGRSTLRTALAEMGVSIEGPILATARGAPNLPGHVRGSVSHKDDIAVALAVSSDAVDGAHVGVDVEVRSASTTDISRMVLTEAERAALVGLVDEDRARAVLLRFSLKEALYKALDPYVQRYVGFLEVEVHPHPDGSATFALQLKHGEGPFHVAGLWLRRDDTYITAARVARATQFTT